MSECGSETMLFGQGSKIETELCSSTPQLCAALSSSMASPAVQFQIRKTVNLACA